MRCAVLGLSSRPPHVNGAAGLCASQDRLCRLSSIASSLCTDGGGTGLPAGTFVFREVEETMAAAPEEAAAGREAAVTRSRFVICEKPLKPPAIAPPKTKAHKRQGIGADPALSSHAPVAELIQSVMSSRSPTVLHPTAHGLGVWGWFEPGTTPLSVMLGRRLFVCYTVRDVYGNTGQGAA